MGPNQTEKNDVKVVGDGGSWEIFMFLYYKSYVYIWSRNIHVPLLQIIYIYIYNLPRFVSKLSLPSHKKGSWGLSGGKWASCRFKKLFPDPNRGAWIVLIMKWNEFSTAIEMLLSRPRQASPLVLAQKMSLSQMFHLLKSLLPVLF